MIQEGPLFHKPKSFLTARKLVYASIFLGILSAIIRYLTIGYTYDLYLTAAIFAFTFVVVFLLVKQMGLCKKWARTTFLALFILGMIFYPVALIQLFKLSLMLAALSLIQMTLAVIAVVFLYSKESNIWFNNSTSELLP